jgi:apolipoprotein N-acyltransferase
MTFSHAVGRWKRLWLPPADDHRRRGADASAPCLEPALQVGGLAMSGILAAPLAAVSIAVFVASPWIDQRLVWCEWVGLAAALLMVGRIRGWWGELWTLLTAATALAIAFHWAPQVLAYAMNAEPHVGLFATAPIVLWDAVRLAVPFWFASRITADPLRAWLPAALLATSLEALLPAVFPWKLGYAQIAWPVLVQSVDLLGPEVTTFVIFAHAGTLAWLAQVIPRVTRVTRSDGRRDWAAVAGPPASLIAVAVCLVNLAYGVGAMAFWGTESESAPTLTVALVQANPEDEGGIDSLRTITTRESRGAGGAIDLVCWPECSGGSYDASLDSLADSGRVADLSRPPNKGMRPLENPACPLLFGGKIYTGHPEKPRALHQSAILIDTSETILGCYHKRHLMPFGEYVPGSDFYPDVRLHFAMQDEFTAGAEARVLTWDQGPRLGVMLCYEDMIPGAARSLVHGSANVLVSLINGSAFTEPLTLAQHRLLSQLRAVECRRSLLRCAATGETCVISPTGEVTASLPLHVRGALVADVPLLESTTLACRIGLAFPLACGAAAAALTFLKRRASR